MPANSQDNQLAYALLPSAASQAVEDSLIACGFSGDSIVKNYKLLSDKTSIKLNALAFTDSLQRGLDDYAGITVYNAVNGHKPHELVKNFLSTTSAPFHLIHSEETFSFWVSNATTQQRETRIDPVKVDDLIAYERLGEVLHKYEVDLKPQRIRDVKRGKDTFRLFPDVHPWQLSLWALELRSKPLVRCFEIAMNGLRHHASHLSDKDAQLIATQILGALILVDTGMLGPNVHTGIRSFAQLMQIAHHKFHHFFSLSHLFDKYHEAASEAYAMLRSIDYAGFSPAMLADLYAAAYTREERKELGNYNTPLYVARRIWDTIPVEYLPPHERVVADMTCGLGSFLITGYERLAQIRDTGDIPLQKCLYGNDRDGFFAQLAHFGMLYTTSHDDWKIAQTDAFTWEWLSQHEPNIIIGNPPFGSDEQDTEDEASENGGNQKAYQFLEYALTRLKPGGYLAMIMPRSFTTLRNGSGFRQRLLRSCDILELWDLPQQVFQDQGTTSRTTVIILQKKKDSFASSHNCVKIRTIQPATVKAFENMGISTFSNLVADQSVWYQTSWKSASGPISEHVIDYSTILSEAQWKEIRKHCFGLGLGPCYKHVQGVKRVDRGQNRQSKYVFYFGHVKSKSREDQIIPQPYTLNYAKAEEVVYSGIWEQLLGSPKLLLHYIQTPVWGRRAKVAIERRGYYASKNFWAIVPQNNLWLSYKLTLEVLAAILNWYVSNAWIIDHLKGPSISAYALETIPIPKDLNEEDCNLLTKAVLVLEQENTSWGLRSVRSQDAEEDIDRILKRAYNLDENTFRHLQRVAQWDYEPFVTLDPQPASDNADWFVNGVVDSVNTAEESICLWIEGFDELQTVQIAPSMPGWLLRSDAAFLTKIPETYREQRHIDPQTIDWGKFYPQPYMYMTEEELLQGITQQFVSKE